ncbi:aminoacyl-tRNA hydrolase [bacterium]|nr:aminoacyl-tRNA hydrolase [bacterium]
MWVVVGLGNPGPEYADTRHNAGFMVVDALARRWRIPLVVDADDRARRGCGVYEGHCVQLIEPLLYMNRSGDVLDHLAADDSVIAVYDDLDLPAGRLRIRARGGAGGHRGVGSLIARLGDAFTRLRIGVGRPPEGTHAADYVLKPVVGADRQALAEAAERACEAIEVIITQGMATAMNRYNAVPTSAADPC